MAVCSSTQEDVVVGANESSVGRIISGFLSSTLAQHAHNCSSSKLSAARFYRTSVQSMSRYHETEVRLL